MTDNKETVEVEDKKEAEPIDQATAEETKVEQPTVEPSATVTPVAQESTQETTAESAEPKEAKPAEETKETSATASEETKATAEEPKEEDKEEPKEEDKEEPKEEAKEEPKEEVKPEPNPLERTVEVKIPKAAIEAERRKIIHQYGKTARLDGFRKGKVPYSVLNDMYGVKAYNEAVEKLLNAEVPKALVDYSSTRVNAPNVSPEPDQDPNSEDLTFKVTFEVMPDFQLPDFKTLKVTKYECTLTDEDVENTIKVMQQQRTVYTDVDRPCKEGDKVTIDFEGKLDGKEFQGGSRKGYSFVLGNGQMLHDFEKELPGMKPGDEKTFKMTFPSNYGSSELAGKEVEFTVKVTEVGDPKVPALDDEFAKAFQVDGGMEELRKNVRENLEREVKNRTAEMTKQSVLNALLREATFPVPNSVVDERRQFLVNNHLESLKSRGINVPADSVPANAYLDQAKNMVKLGYLVTRIVSQNGIYATESQIKALVTEISKSYEDPEEVVSWYMSDKDRKNEIAAIVTENNAVDWVVDNADTTKQEYNFKDLMAQQAQQL